MSLKIILVSGPSGYGKTMWGTVASEYGEDPRVRPMAFAAPVKAEAIRRGLFVPGISKTQEVRDTLWLVSQSMLPTPLEMSIQELKALPRYVEVAVFTDHRYAWESQAINQLFDKVFFVRLTEKHRYGLSTVEVAQAARRFTLDVLNGGSPTWD